MKGSVMELHLQLNVQRDLNLGPLDQQAICRPELPCHTVFIRLWDRVFGPLEWLQITKSVLWNFVIIPILPFLDNPKDLDPSCKMDLDLWDCFGREKLCLITAEIQYSEKVHYCTSILQINCSLNIFFEGKRERERERESTVSPKMS